MERKDFMIKLQKLLILVTGVVVSTVTFTKEIIPENYLLENLILPISLSKTYLLDGKQIKAIRVSEKIGKKLNTLENPFYIYDSNGEEKMVRYGDYFYSTPKLSTIYMLSKSKFERKVLGIEETGEEEKSITLIGNSESNEVK